MRPYMTEEDARKKWCPMVRVGDTGDFLPERVKRDLQNGTRIVCCIGSRCMWWGTADDLAEVDRRGTHQLGRCEGTGGAA
jgi:hypothetical protein